jgi:patatin-like phospholipase/acyl hydrolase
VYKSILSLDGGGLLGIVPLTVLRYLEEKTGKPSASLFQLISGASTGGIIALALSVPNATKTKPLYTAEDVLRFYQTDSRDVFQKSLLGKLCSFSALSEAAHHFFFSKYTEKGIETCFQRFFGDTQLSQAITHVLVPAYNLSHKGKKEPRLKLFSSYKACTSSTSFKGDYAMADVARATSAVPTYFPPKKLQRRSLSADKGPVAPFYSLIDGALATYDPSLVAYAHSQHLFGEETPLLLLSLGTSTIPLSPYLSVIKRRSPGIWAWRPMISRLMMDPGRSVQQNLLHTLLKSKKGIRYQRLIPESNNFSFDDLSVAHRIHLENTAHHAIKTLWADTLREWIALLKG